jgi:hypothetical protein
MDTQMNSLAKDIAGGMNKTYLDPKVLPFKVISIDVISGQPFITIDDEHSNRISGWRQFSRLENHRCKLSTFIC